jgi:DNA mismatch repair protein MutL
MPKIKRLPLSEAQKIAAGEVVERPANVVKELIENSLDAGATDISLFLEDGGKKLIRILDNGSGMSAEDAHLSIEHHATSKIKGVADLERISTFGFRGEALSSISSVSRLVLTTKEEHALAATSLTIEDSKIIDESTVSANTGTDIQVHNLFYNVPARQKFLRSKDTEMRAIVQMFQAFCLSYPAVSFKFYSEGRLLYTIASTDSLADRMSKLCEPSLKKNLLFTQAAQERMNLSCTITLSGTSYSRYDRSLIFVFVNHRWVKNHKLAQAFIKGYQNILQPQRYPAGVIDIVLDQSAVDVNIHPRKEEVQFLHPRIVEDLISTAVHNILLTDHTKSMEIAVTPARREMKMDRSFSEPRKKYADYQSKLPFTERAFEKKNEEPSFATIIEKHFSSEQIPAEETQKPQVHQQLEYRLIGQYHKTYILLETDSGLVFIDQHAAHERIMYEKLRAHFDEVSRVRLIFPQIISLNTHDLDLFEPSLALLESFGIEAQRTGPAELAITHTPLFLKNQSLEESIKQAIGVLHEYTYLDANELKKIMHERVHASLSCKAAVKAGDELNIESMHELIKDLHASANKLTCPHGRPTQWIVGVSEIEKKFKRDYRS